MPASRKSSYARGYDNRWRKERLHYLDRNPLCVFCEKEGVITAATVVDHKIPHRGDMEKFWDIDNWQSLCESCHNQDKQRMEKGTYKEYGLDGFPKPKKENVK